MNALILGAGGPAAIGVIKALKDSKFNGKIVSIDSNELSAGFFLSDSYHVVPNYDDESYVKILLNIVKEECIDFILPTSNDIITLTREKKKFKDIILYMSDYKTIELCNDKYKFFEKCKEANLPIPRTLKKFDKVFTKPRYGKGSIGAKLIDFTETDHLYQDYLRREYTIDLLSDLNAKILTSVIRERVQTKAGISTKAKIIKNDYITKNCHKLATHFNLKGPVCIQMKEDENCTPKFIEVNPRFGVGLILAL